MQKGVGIIMWLRNYFDTRGGPTLAQLSEFVLLDHPITVDRDPISYSPGADPGGG